MNFFKRFFRRNSGEIVGIDIGCSTIKIAQITSRDGQNILTAAGAYPLPPDIVANYHIVDPAGLAENLRTALTQSGASAKTAIISVGSHNSVIRTAAFPPMPAEELATAVKWDIDKYVPYEPDTYYFDFAALESAGNDHEMPLFLVAAPKTAIDTLVEVAKLTGLRLAAVETEALALFRLLPGTADGLLLDIGAESTAINLYHNGCPMVTRSVNIGGTRFSETIARALELQPEEAERLKLNQAGLLQRPGLEAEATALHSELMLLINDLSREIRRTVDYFQIQNREFVLDTVYATGGGASLDNLLPQLSVALDTSVHLLNPFQSIAAAPSFDQRYLQRLGPQLAIAAGLALRGGGL